MRNFTDKNENEWLLDACDITSEDVDLRNHEGTLVIGTPDGEVETMDICDIDENKYPADVVDAAKEVVDATIKEYDEKMTKIMDAARETAPDKRIDNVEMLSGAQIYAVREDAIDELAVKMLSSEELSIEINDSCFLSDHTGGWIYLNTGGVINAEIGRRGNDYGQLYAAGRDCVAELVPARQLDTDSAAQECWEEMPAEEKHEYLTGWCRQNNRPETANMITMDQVGDDGVYGAYGVAGLSAVYDLVHTGNYDDADKFLVDLVADKGADYITSPAYLYMSDGDLLQNCATFYADKWVKHHTGQEPYNPSEDSPVYDQCAKKEVSR